MQARGPEVMHLQTRGGTAQPSSSLSRRTKKGRRTPQRTPCLKGLGPLPPPAQLRPPRPPRPTERPRAAVKRPTLRLFPVKRMLRGRAGAAAASAAGASTGGGGAAAWGGRSYRLGRLLLLLLLLLLPLPADRPVCRREGGQGGAVTCVPGGQPDPKNHKS